MRDLSVLSDIEFEDLVADLFSADLGEHVERFARGADGGIDLRWTRGPKETGIGQCKHYTRSTFAQLRAAAKAEVPHLEVLKPQVYRFVTSFDLSPGQKDALVAVLSPWLSGPDDVYGGRDIDGLITRFETVERAHPKLWLTTGTQLFWATHSDLATRAAALRARIEMVIPRYVTNASFGEASALLEKHRTCVIAGLPGIGKTTLAYALVADAIARGYEPIEVSEDINEAWTAFRPDVPQVFLYDDFLGQLTFSERLGKNEDARLADFIDKLTGTKSKLLVMTTREYILQDAQRIYGRLAAIDTNRRFVLELEDYTRRDRARILYNHLWHADLPATALREIAAGGCIPIVDHPNYSPRLVEFCTGSAFDRESPDYPGRFVEHLAHPEHLWRTAFEDHLTTVQQLLAVTLATLPPRPRLDDLRLAHEGLCARRGVGVTAAEFRSALQIMEGSVVSVSMTLGTSTVEFHNPSVRSFVLDWLGQDRTLVTDVVDGAVYFEQVSRLHQYATGTRGSGATAESGSAALERSVRQASANVIAGLVRLVASPSPERSGHWRTGTDGSLYAEVPASNWRETRLEAIVRMPPEVRPPGAWLAEQLSAATEFWRQGLGHKAHAVKLLRTVGTGTEAEIPGEVVRDAGKALDDWLADELDDLDDDWMPYLDRLKTAHHVDLSRAEEIAARFEEFVENQIAGDRPSSSSLGELMEVAEEFGLDELYSGLDDIAAEERAEDERAAASQDRLPASRQSITSRADFSDDALTNLFARLAPGSRDDTE